MTNPQNSTNEPAHRDFFISYTGRDQAWAEWIGAELENAGYTVFLKIWDILPGNNFVLALDQALRLYERCLLVISPAYLQDGFAMAQWATAFCDDPTGKHRKLLPVLIERCKLEGLLASHEPIDLIGLEQADARRHFLDSITAERLKPQQNLYPGKCSNTSYPGSVPVSWNIPYRYNPYFTGREEHLAVLYSRLHNRQSAVIGRTEAISGLGGIGKTQLAIEYAWRYRAEYTHVFWVDSETRETLTASYNEIAELLDLPEKDVREQKRIVEAVKRWLRIHQNYLLIFDNANTPAFLNFFLPSDPTGHLLITTRSAHANEAGLGLTESLAIGVLTPELGAQLLLRRSGRLALATSEELVQAAALADELGGLPLALDQAGAYMASRQINSESYHELYQRHHLRLLKERYNKWEHPEAVITTWNISFQAVEQQNVAAAELLRFCAFLAPEEISKEILTKGTSVLGPVLAPVSADELSLDEAIEILREYSLVDRNGVKKTIKVHRLVQAVVRENMPNREKKIWEKRVIGAIQAAFPRPDFANWATCEYILPHARLCMDWIQQSRLFSGAAANLLTQAGAYLQYRGRYTEAELMLERALAIRKVVLGANHAGTASSLNNLATLYQAQGRYSEAEPLYTRSLVIRERELGANHPETTDSLCNLAGLYCMQGNYSKAEPLLVRALAAFEQSSEINYPHKAHSLSNLGLLYQEQGKYSQAEPLLVQALATFEQELGADHPETAGGLKNLGSFYQEQGRYDEAEPLLLRALAIYERELSTNHPMTASSLNSLSTLYQKQGRYDEAEPLLVRTLAIYEREPDTDYIHIATSLNNLGLLYQKQGRLPEAEALLVRAKTLSEQELGSSHPHTATSLSSLAGLYATRGKYAEAELLYQQALRIYESELGPKHHNAAQVMNNLAGLYHTQGHVAEAERLYILALASYALAFGRKKPPSIHIIGENYANLLREQGREEEARQVERSILGTVHT